MKKENLIEQLNAAKSLSSQVDIDKMIELINKLELPKTQLFTQELADEIANKIESRLDNNSNDLVDLDSAEFELNYDNKVELNRVDINCSEIMDLITDVIGEYVNEEDWEGGVSASEFTPSED